MPDEDLIQLAAAGKLRANLGLQVKRMLADSRSAAFVENFTGQWLQTRLVTTVPLNPREIMARERRERGWRRSGRRRWRQRERCAPHRLENRRRKNTSTTCSAKTAASTNPR